VSVIDGFCLQCLLGVNDWAKKSKSLMFAADLSSGEQKKEERVPRAFGKEVPIYFAVFCSCVFIVFVGGNV